MITVGAFEAKTKFSELLDRVEKGEEVIITRRGKTVARLASVQGAGLTDRVKSVVDAMAAVREVLRRRGASLTIDDILAARDEGRR